MRHSKSSHRQQGEMIEFLPSGLKGVRRPEESVLDVALRLGVPINHSCEGMGSCTTCRIFVLDGLSGLHPRNEIEGERAEERDFPPEERLACQTMPSVDLKVQVPD